MNNKERWMEYGIHDTRKVIQINGNVSNNDE